MAYGSRDIAAAFRTVRANTIKSAEDIPENKYDFRPSPEGRTIAQTIAHIAVGPSFQLAVHQNKVTDLKTMNFMELFAKFGAEETKPRTKAELIAFLKSEGEKFATFVENLPPAFLEESVAMPPGAEPASKSRFEMLLSPKEHEMHHRGQLMMLERMVGVVPHLTRQQMERMAQMQAAAAGQAAR
jgi:uncharacterized damage-inducible protein DinB